MTVVYIHISETSSEFYFLGEGLHFYFFYWQNIYHKSPIILKHSRVMTIKPLKKFELEIILY